MIRKKTASSHNARGWSTLGDIGYVDADGFVYLSDRRTDLILPAAPTSIRGKSRMCLSNIHRCWTVAVIGVPSLEFGPGCQSRRRTKGRRQGKAKNSLPI